MCRFISNFKQERYDGRPRLAFKAEIDAGATPVQIGNLGAFNMSFAVHPIRALDGDRSPSSDVSNNIAIEDWDLLFDAVAERLRSTSEFLDPSIDSRRSLTLAQTRDIIAECAQALDLLHLMATSESARGRQTDGVGHPLTRPSAHSLNAENSPKVPFEVVRTIWHAWHGWQENRRARIDGLPPA